MRPSTKPSILALSLIGLVASCASAPSLARQPGHGPFALPGVSGSYFSFGDQSYGPANADSKASVPKGAGAARAAAVDQVEGIAMVAYANQLAIADLGSGETTWLPLKLSSDFVRINLHEGFGALTSGSEVQLYNLAEARLLWTRDVSAELRRAGASRLEGAAPLGPGKLCLIGSKQGGKPVKVIKFNTAQGDWQMSGSTSIDVLSELHSVTLDSEDLFLGGVRNSVQMGAGRSMGRHWQDLMVMRLNLQNMEVSELVKREQQARSTWVRQVAFDHGRLAVLMGSGLIYVFRIREESSTNTLIWDKNVAGATSIAWVGSEGDRLVVAGPGGDQSFDLN